MPEHLELPLAAIAVGTDRARDLDPAWAEGLAGIIAAQGLMQPVVVREKGGRYHLVAGLHRVEAFRLLGRETIPAVLSGAASDDEAKLAEVMENLGRHDLIALDRCHHLFELKQVWERMYPQAKHGGDRGNQHTGGKSQTLALGTDAPEIFGFARATADRIGLSPSAIKMAVKIWSGLVPTVRRRLVGTDLAHKQTELKALSELPATRQIKVLDLIENPALPEVGNVAQALAYLANGIVPDMHEKRFAAVVKVVRDLDDDMLDRVLDANEERIIASLTRRGRI
ncbi:ParB/RepB/Spo0J family partition protein [Paracoccus sp. p3-h83]|uniref:ParB/RepB/Spo0J family partition protein n=1 Tax=Paracoccus sp. p3-h83 TaxID=3342805 RepID=UPI0035BA2FAB